MKTAVEMIGKLSIGLSLSMALSAQVPTYTVSTVMGSYSLTDDSPNAPLGSPQAVAVDATGNVYFTDTTGNRIRKYDITTGKTSTVAGDGTIGAVGGTAAGIGGPAVKAKLWQPAGLAFDSAGNLLISDSFDHNLLKVDSAGVLTLVAGTGSAGYNGDSAPAIYARLRNAHHLALDSKGNIFIADKENNRIRYVSPDGVMHTLAGVGGNSTTTAHAFSGDGGPAVQAGLGQPEGVALDSYGNIYIADTASNRIRLIQMTDALGNPLLDAKGQKVNFFTATIQTVVGGGAQCVTGGATAAQCATNTQPLNAVLSGPRGIAVDSKNNLYISDSGNNRILYLNNNLSSCAIVPGGGVSCNSGATLTNILPGNTANSTTLFTNTALSTPTGLALSPDGTQLYIAETGGNRIRRYNISTGESAFIAQAQTNPISGSHGIAIDPTGLLVINDTSNNRILKVAADGSRTLVSGVGGAGFPTAGGDNFQTVMAVNSKVSAPWGGAYDSLGNYYFADRGNNRVRMIAPGGTITTIAGGNNSPLPTTGPKAPTVSTAAGYAGDGFAAIQGQLRNPTDVAVDTVGGTNACPVAPCIYIADSGNHVVRQVANGIMTTFAGAAPTCATLAGPPPTGSCTGASGADGDGWLANQAQLNTPEGVAVDPAGNVYIADTNNHTVRKVDARSLTINILVGLAYGEGRSADSVQGAISQEDDPVSLTVAPDGGVIFADGCLTSNAWGQCLDNRIRRWDPKTGTVTTISSGSNTAALASGTLDTTGGIASTKFLSLVPTYVTSDSKGNLYVTDYTNRVLKFTVAPATPAK